MIRSLRFSAYSTDEILEKFKANSDFNPTLGIIFSSVSLDIPTLSSTLSDLNIPVVGCSTSGEILSDSDSSPVYSQTAVCCFINPNQDSYAIKLFEMNDDPDAEYGKRIGEWGMHTFKKPAFILLISGLDTSGEAVVRGIKAVCPEQTPIFGGIAGDDGRFEKTYVFSHEGYSARGVTVLIFDRSKVEMSGFATSGWVGVGVDMTVTSSEGNVVYTINDHPATSIYKEYLNVSDEMLQQVGVMFPLLLKRTDGSEVLRTFLSVDSEKEALIFAGSIPIGSKVQFSSSFGYETIEKTIDEMHGFHAVHPTADLIFLFSCIARHQVAGSMVDDEISTAAGLWNAPLIGFFTYGEIGNNLEGVCDFYNETICLTLIRFMA